MISIVIKALFLDVLFFYDIRYILHNLYRKFSSELKRLRQKNEEQLLGEIQELKAEEDDENSNDTEWNLFKVLFDKTLLLPLLLVCSLQAGQQFSGINAVSLEVFTNISQY